MKHKIRLYNTAARLGQKPPRIIKKKHKVWNLDNIKPEKREIPVFNIEN